MILIFLLILLVGLLISYWGWYRLNINGELGFKIINFYFDQVKFPSSNWRQDTKHARDRCDDILDVRWSFWFSIKTGFLWALGFKETVIKMYPYSEEYRHIFDEI